MPLAAPPSRGFEEFQRTGPWDSPSLFSENNAGKNGRLDTPVIDVSRYGYIGGYDLTSTLDVLTQYEWFVDRAGTTPIGTVMFTQSVSIGAFQQLRLPNLGPFLVASWLPLGGSNWTHTCQIIGTNRYHPLQFIPSNPVLVDQQNVALAATTTAVLYPVDYYAGPLQVWTTCTQASSLQIQYLNAAGVWSISFVQTMAAGVNTTFDLVVPPGAWRILTRNTSAVASTFYTVATPSTSGAS